MGKKFAFHVRSNTASNYSKQMIICEVPIGGSSQHLLAYRSPPAERAAALLEPEPESEPESPAAARASSIVQVVDTDMPAAQRDEMISALEALILEMRDGKKPEEAQVDDSKLAEEIKQRIQLQLKWAPTWHVITGAEKLSGWDSAITAEKGSRFSAISRPIKVEIFKHNELQLLPPVGHTMHAWGCNAWLLQAAAYLVAVLCGATFVWVSLSIPEDDTVNIGPLAAGWMNLTSAEVPQPTVRYHMQVGTGAFLLLAAVIKISSKLAAHGNARRLNSDVQKKK